MIIGISGKIGSGKDTVGRIIQYLISKSVTSTVYLLSHEKKYYNPLNILMDFEGFCVNYTHYWAGNGTEINGWKVVKFADKLKECISIITGISREDLEKSEVKNRVLGEEWMYHSIMNFGEDKYERFPYLGNENRFPSIPHATTVRELLQEFGTEVGRQIHPNFWVNALFSEYKNFHTDKFSVREGINDPEYPNWIITDMRFPNELEAIKKRKGITIRVNRNKQINTRDHSRSYLSHQSIQHPSETALDNAVFDYIIDNNGSIEELIEKVKEILINEKII